MNDVTHDHVWRRTILYNSAANFIGPGRSLAKKNNKSDAMCMSSNVLNNAKLSVEPGQFNGEQKFWCVWRSIRQAILTVLADWALPVIIIGGTSHVHS